MDRSGHEFAPTPNEIISNAIQGEPDMKSRTANFFRWTTIAVALLLAMGAVQDALER